MLRHILCCSIVAFAGEAFAVNYSYNELGDYPKDHVTTSGSLNFTANPEPGYRFDYWVIYYSGESTTTTNRNDQTITLTWAGQGSRKINLYVYFTEADFTVTFKANGGSVSPKTKSYTYKSTYHDLPTPTRTGYEFAGWYLGETRINEGDSFLETANCTLVAHWTAKPFTVSVVKENCNLDVTPMSGKYGDSIQISWSPFARDGMSYKLQTMVLRTPGGTELASYLDGYSPQSYTMNGEYYPELVVEGRYSQTPISYKILFDGYGGNVSKSEIETQYGQVISLSTVSATREGYTLSGWWGGSPTGVWYALDASVSNLTTAAGGTYTFYADWTANVSTNAYHGNGADSGETAEQQVLYGNPYQLAANGFARTGYTFDGWTTNLSHAAEFTDGAIVSNLTSLAGGKVDFYATWKANDYRCVFDSNGATSGSISSTNVHYDEIFELPTNGFNRTGYTLSGWRAGSSTGEHVALGAAVSNLTTAAGGTYTFYADWTANVSTNVYHGNGEDTGSMSEQPVTYDQPYELLANQYSRTGYTFAGWTTNLSHAAEFTDGATVSNLTSLAGGKVNFYATWKANDYSCAFDGNGATSGSVDSMEVHYDEIFQLPENGFVRSGYTFTGWGTSEVGGTLYQPGDSLSNLTVVADAEVKIFAQWQVDLTDLNYALGYTDSPVSNNVPPTEGLWVVITNINDKGELYDCVRGALTNEPNVVTRCQMETWIEGPAHVIFDMRAAGLDDGVGSGGFPYELKVDFTHSSGTNNLARIVTNTEWTKVELDVPENVGRLVWVLSRKGFGKLRNDCWVEIDNLVVTPIAPHPDPKPGDEPTISTARFGENGFIIGFVGDERFDYQLFATESLQPANWQRVDVTLQPRTGEEIKVVVEPSKPSMFYKVEVLKRQ